jgi:hypothetical protein
VRSRGCHGEMQFAAHDLSKVQLDCIAEQFFVHNSEPSHSAISVLIDTAKLFALVTSSTRRQVRFSSSPSTKLDFSSVLSALALGFLRPLIVID